MSNLAETPKALSGSLISIEVRRIVALSPSRELRAVLSTSLSTINMFESFLDKSNVIN